MTAEGTEGPAEVAGGGHEKCQRNTGFAVLTGQAGTEGSGWRSTQRDRGQSRAEHTLHMTGGKDGPTREQMGRNHRHETQ